MNPLTKVKLINKLNEREAQLGVKETVSWHSEYKNSAWIFVGGFPYDLTEGDLICVFSQYGEIVNINLVRDKKTGKSKGFCFICYEDQRSTILAVDNFNGIKIKGRTIRVDHVKDYRPPKDSEDIDDITKRLREDGCAPLAPEPPSSPEDDEQYVVPVKKHKDKKQRRKKKKEKSSSPSPFKIKQEKIDDGYSQQRVLEYSRLSVTQAHSEGQEPGRRLGSRHGDQGTGEQERRREGGNEQQESRRVGREQRPQARHGQRDNDSNRDKQR